MIQFTEVEILYLTDLFKEIRDGVDEGVLDEISQAEEMLNAALDRYYEEQLGDIDSA